MNCVRCIHVAAVSIDFALSVTSRINCIAARCLINAVYLTEVMVTLCDLNDIAYDAESTKNRKSCHNRKFEE